MANPVDQEYLEVIVRGIVNNPQDVKIERTIDERGVLLTLHINQADMGYVIGREGQTARAIRTLLRIVGAKANARVNLKIYEPEGSRPPRMERPAVDTSAVDDLNIWKSKWARQKKILFFCERTRLYGEAIYIDKK